MIKVFVVFKTNVFIECVQPFLHGIEVAAVCNKTDIALEKYKSLNPDVVIMDANWTSHSYAVSGPSLVKNLIDFDPSVKIIVVTNLYDPDIPEQFMELGVRGYFYRTNSIGVITTCIREVHKGNTWVAGKMDDGL